MRKRLPWDLFAQKTAKFPPSITLFPIHYKQRQFQFLALMAETEHFKTFAQGGRPRPPPPYAKNLAHRSRQSVCLPALDSIWRMIPTIITSRNVKGVAP